MFIKISDVDLGKIDIGVQEFLYQTVHFFIRRGAIQVEDYKAFKVVFKQRLTDNNSVSLKVIVRRWRWYGSTTERILVKRCIGRYAPKLVTRVICIIRDSSCHTIITCRPSASKWHTRRSLRHRRTVDRKAEPTAFLLRYLYKSNIPLNSESDKFSNILPATIFGA